MYLCQMMATHIHSKGQTDRTSHSVCFAFYQAIPLSFNQIVLPHMVSNVFLQKNCRASLQFFGFIAF